MLNFLSVMLLSSAPNEIYYAQHYAHNYCNYATVHIQFYYFNDYISILWLGSSLLCFSFYLLCYATVFLHFSYYAEYYVHEKTYASFCAKLT